MSQGGAEGGILTALPARKIGEGGWHHISGVYRTCVTKEEGFGFIPRDFLVSFGKTKVLYLFHFPFCILKKVLQQRVLPEHMVTNTA